MIFSFTSKSAISLVVFPPLSLLLTMGRSSHKSKRRKLDSSSNDAEESGANDRDRDDTSSQADDLDQRRRNNSFDRDQNVSKRW